MSSDATNQHESPEVHDRPRLSQAERTARTRSRLFRACLDIVAERGYQRASLAAIGERAGYSRGVVNFQFGSKASLLGELVEYMYGRWTQSTLDPVSRDRDAVDALCASIDSVREQARNTPVDTRAFYLLLFEALGPLPELQPRFAALHDAVRTRTADQIHEGIEDGCIRSDVNPHAQAALVIGAIRGAMYQWLLDPEHVDLDVVLDELQRNVRRTLEPTQPPQRRNA